MSRCKMIPFEQLREWQKQDSLFKPLPVWLERNPRYCDMERWPKYEATVIELLDDMEIGEEAEDSAYFLGGGNYMMTSYNKFWRLWYADGANIPKFDAPWERFSWDHRED